LSTCLRPLLLEISCVDISGGFLVEWPVVVRGCWKLERLRSSAYEAFRVSCMRSIEGDLASVPRSRLSHGRWRMAAVGRRARPAAGWRRPNSETTDNRELVFFK